MTGTQPRKADLPATVTAFHDCDRRCESEFDLEGVSVRFTVGMMLRTVDRAHDAAHAANPPVRSYTGTPGVVVRATALPGQAHRPALRNLQVRAA